MSVLVANFSHPLTDEAKQQIEKHFPKGSVSYHTIPVQVKHDQFVMPQIEEFVRPIVGDWQVVLVNPPGYASTAVLIVDALRKKYCNVGLIVLKPVKKNEVQTVFLLNDIVMLPEIEEVE